MPYLAIPSGRIFYKDFLPSSAAPRATLIFHHGIGSNHTFYRPIIPALTSSPHSFRCITYDIISSGLSDLATKPQSIESLAQDAIEVLDALGVKEKVIFVGHSMGGIVASEVAATRGERVIGAVMMGAPLPGAKLMAAFEKRVEAVEKDKMEAMADTLPEGATGSKSTPVHHAFIRALLLSTNPEAYISMCKLTGKVSPPDYAAIRMPTLMIAGTEDKGAPPPDCEEIVRRSGGKKKIEVLDGVGHWFCIEVPETTAHLVGEFVEEVIGGK